LDIDIHSWDVEGLKHDLSHALSVSLGVQGSLSKQHRVLLGSHTKLSRSKRINSRFSSKEMMMHLVVESVVPNLLHIIPVRHDTVLDRIL
jgi:hypothetical protein